MKRLQDKIEIDLWKKTAHAQTLKYITLKVNADRLIEAGSMLERLLIFRTNDISFTPSDQSAAFENWANMKKEVLECAK